MIAADARDRAVRAPPPAGAFKRGVLPTTAASAGSLDAPLGRWASRGGALGLLLALAAACGDDAGGGATDAGLDGGGGALAERALAADDLAGLSRFDVVPDVSGDGRDDVVLVYFPRVGPEVVIARLVGDTLERVASIEGGSDGLAGPRALVADVGGDVVPELVMAHPYEGVLRAFATPIAGDRDAGDAVATLDGPRNSFFATAHARGALLAGGADAIAIATPGEPEEACFSAEPPVLLARPWPATGAVATVAAARVGADDPFDCPGVWLSGARDWTGDGVADLVATTTSGGARLLAGPIADGRPFASGTALPVGRGPYGGYGVAAGALVDVDGDGALDLGLLDLQTRSLRVWTAPVDPARSIELALADDGAPVLVDGPRDPDLDRDGDNDLVVQDQLFNPAALAVLTLPDRTRYTRAGTFSSARTGDLDGDGQTEVLLLTPEPRFVLVHLP